MQRKLNSPGEFARAYVIAHQVGHHVQRLLGYSDRVDQSRGERRARPNLTGCPCDCSGRLSGGRVVGTTPKRSLTSWKGDIESALNAAFQIGDDRLQKQARGYVVPDAFTHGTSKQRMRWFKAGIETGDVRKRRLLFELDYGNL